MASEPALFPQAGQPPDAARQIASLPLAVLLLGPGLVIASANPAAEQFLGQSLRRLTGRALGEVLHFAEARLGERIAEGDGLLSAHQADVTVLGMGARCIDVTVAPVTDRAGWQMLTLHDASSAEAMGEGRNAGEEGVLRAPAILAHEIKNPLAGIRGAAQLLARKLPERERALTTLIADEVDRIAKLIDQMQNLSRRSTEPLGPCNLHEAVRRTGAILAAAGGAAPIEEEFDPSLPAVLATQHALVQVIMNLLTNAREASSVVANPRVVVRTRFASGLLLRGAGAEGPVRLPIELRVSDNGPGIDPALRDHIFEPFVSGKTAGQGLGLALVRKLVRDMNGRISHEREEGAKGAESWTHFRLHLQSAPMEKRR